MRECEPSFHRLFRRSHYRSAKVDLGEGEVDPEREHRERFAVAALAFCLKHEPEFLKHFWESVCRVPDDPVEMPPIQADGVLLEPPHWADLRLVSDNGGVRFLWVIEVKAGAPLEDKQNPTESAKFTHPDLGYGDLLVKEEGKRGTRLRYIVLGADPPPEICPGEKILGISVQAREWRALLPGLKATGIVKDLIECLGELRINPFFMEKVKEIIVESGLQGVGKAYQVLETACELLGIKSACRWFESDHFEDGGGYMGFFLKPPSDKGRPSEIYRKLRDATRSDGDCIGFLGYTYDSDGHVLKEVWFYLNEKKRQERLLQRLKGKFPSARPDRDMNALTVAVTSPPEPFTKDLDWFDSVLRNAAG
jgi:hypothetical protein